MRPEFQNLKIPLPIAIIGLGLSGEAILRLLLAAGVERSQILTFDQKSPADFQDPHQLMTVGQPASLCLSPGVALKTRWIQSALSKGLRLTSELEIAFAFLTSETVVAVTGAVGKSTTTAALGAGAAAVDPNSFVGGNLGFPLANYSSDLIIRKRKQAQYLILELSSYQLENFPNLRCQVGVLTHLSPNHLERYESLQHYFDTKASMFRHVRQAAVLNRNGGEIQKQLPQLQSQNSNLKWILTDRHDSQFIGAVSETPRMIGSHNMDNLAVAFAVAKELSWPVKSFEAMLRFPGLSHRLENCGLQQNILFLNDSKATSVESVLQALSSVVADHPKKTIHLLVGGQDKNLPWENLSIASRHPQVHAYFFGSVAPIAQSKSGLPGLQFSKLGPALAEVKTQARSGDIILLSPGGTSWDEFKNFEERGHYFKKWMLTEFQGHKS